ncbi:sugar O-acetyltransferase [Clostridium saccharobutylicum]|uniref:Acetyltransferase n=1 Tax=Clostridium saccharobutylicum DSM 13864 TaxID=1345695 RepID=U5MSF1_CLOSA|nr:sugar O-acetyltransferase [Clostridium saccharobutylicum]AGX43530.1 galactoside O-acetyltransferase LacA [Clostridium saccharobutylicum DSM 13864]AQR90827.1 galactoside O-acetyltransferase [Clostridium saccharobutylicum]AQS00731.1 galactoside O-acetyltransferase [Clostridium saccharobutylicum]AQS10391.1 galactoside O-acetyltransferase [Clostridium saccharobutylicum]AQS14714.1 galactoside O-acetyltransferase [Clostridium saccharobutylicum]
MTEKEKMLRGKPYKSFEETLLNERQHAKELLFDFNALRPSEIKKRNDIIKNLFGKTGESFFIEPPFRCDYGYNIEIGENFYSNYNCIILDCAKVTIGNNVFLAPNVGIYTAGHPIHYEPRNEEYEYAFSISIGNNVWIGGNTVINPGVNVGDNCVIGSGSVITKDIPANCIAVGNPCRVIREITDEDKNYYFKKLKFENED